MKAMLIRGVSVAVIAVAVMLVGHRARAAGNPEREAYFGETHIHTSWSVDAWVMGNRITGPADAYKYAQGETIKHPLGFDIKIDTPLDFMGVTDHSEYVGVTKEANTPGSYVSKLPEAQPMIMKDANSQADQQKVFSYLLSLASRPPVKAFMDPKITSTVWKENVRIAETEQQKQQIVPILKEEIEQLQALKKDTALNAVRKVERLREIGSSFDAKVTPLLNAEQQPKFQALRDQARRRLIEAMGSEALHKLEGEVEKKL